MRDVDVAFIPYSVHHFLPVRFGNNILIEDQGGPAIFHYPNCGLDRFIARFTGNNTNRINTYAEDSFAEQDLYGRAQAFAVDDDIEGLTALYEELIMITNPRLNNYLLTHGFLIRKQIVKTTKQIYLIYALSNSFQSPLTPDERRQKEIFVVYLQAIDCKTVDHSFYLVRRNILAHTDEPDSLDNYSKHEKPAKTQYVVSILIRRFERFIVIRFNKLFNCATSSQKYRLAPQSSSVAPSDSRNLGRSDFGKKISGSIFTNQSGLSRAANPSLRSAGN